MRAVRDYTKVPADASIYNGREAIGFLIYEGKECIALDADHAFVGRFPDRQTASSAIAARRSEKARAA